jgi:protein involved in plasmid replication-relaxation
MNGQSARGASGAPPTVIVCAGQRALAQGWKRWNGVPAIALLRLRISSSDWRRISQTLALAARAGGRPARLVERLGCGPAPPAELQPFSLDTIAEPLPVVARDRPPLRQWATSAATSLACRANARERLAALTLTTDADEKLLTNWVGQHPLLEAVLLAVLLARPVETIERRLDRLVHSGMSEVITRPTEGDDSAPKRFVLTNFGLRWLAARDGVPPRRYAEHGVIAATSGSNGTTNTRLDGLLGHFEHSVGVNRVLARFASNVRRAGHHLAEWRSDAEPTRRFRDGDCSYWIRPHPGGSLLNRGTRHEFLLEYNRGTERAADYRSKLIGYLHYFGSREFEQDGDERPTVLVVTVSDQAELRIADAVGDAQREIGPRLPRPLASSCGGGQEAMAWRGFLPWHRRAWRVDSPSTSPATSCWRSSSSTSTSVAPPYRRWRRTRASACRSPSSAVQGWCSPAARARLPAAG